MKGGVCRDYENNIYDLGKKRFFNIACEVGSSW